MNKTPAQEKAAHIAALKLAKILYLTGASEITFEFSPPGCSGDEGAPAIRVRVDAVCNCQSCVSERREEIALKQDKALIEEVLEYINESED